MTLANSLDADPIICVHSGVDHGNRALPVLKNHERITPLSLDSVTRC